MTDFAGFLRFINLFNYLDRKFFKTNENEDFRIGRIVTMGVLVLNQFMRMKNLLVFAAEKFNGEQNLTPLPITRMSENMEKQLKLVHNVAEFKDRPNKRICVTMLRQNPEKPEKHMLESDILQERRRKRFFKKLFW